MPRSLPTILMAGSLLLTASSSATAAEGIRPVLVDGTTNAAAAVIVDGARHLVYTSQILPLDEQARDIAVGDAERQAQAVLVNLDHALTPAGSGLDRLVRVNVYLTRADVLPAFQAVFARRMEAKGARPSVTYVVTALPHPRVLLGLDAVAVTSAEPSRPGRVERFNLSDLNVQRPGNHAAILPAGARAFISGQAEPGANLAESTRKTLEGLDATLKHLGLSKKQVVQAKAFIQPIASLAEAESEILDFFGPAAFPTLTYVEWKSSAKQPIEIELVVAAGQRAEPEPVEFLAPPQLKQSPVFSRVVRVNRGDLIYTSGFLGAAGKDAASQVGAAFDLLGKAMKESGGDFRHLAKATYYVTDEESSRALNEIRPKLYDPSRPPAASKAMVAGLAPAGHSAVLDMIAVAKPGTGGRP